ncbi:PAS fold family protein, partial [Vibrio parahaemolyticus V-223/04]
TTWVAEALLRGVNVRICFAAATYALLHNRRSLCTRT